ncbi:hypothetical protein [Cupriavidus malaysiensis]|uniref:hypothetical protein n=1 Tax=Cupriavidus malaysiensis TaxID=367825 RepID=UPI000A01F9C8|nr:hypothetical protein [Cupriavidus malaysiensis]
MIAILSDVERTAIRNLAAGDRSQLPLATAAFERAAREFGVDACVELQFMSEVLAPTPDLLLRARYPAAVLKCPL